MINLFNLFPVYSRILLGLYKQWFQYFFKHFCKDGHIFHHSPFSFFALERMVELASHFFKLILTKFCFSQCGKRKTIPGRTVVAACPNKRQIAAVRTMGLICNSAVEQWSQHPHRSRNGDL